MANESARQLHGQLRESQNRYGYFLLAVAASAIAFAVTKTETAALEYSHVPIAIAALSWAASFYNGCVYIGFVQSNINANLGLLQVQSGDTPDIGSHPQKIAAASEGIRRAFESNSKTAQRAAQWQFRYLVIGSLWFVAWHILQMAQR